jgi:hypothetical protein
MSIPAGESGQQNRRGRSRIQRIDPIAQNLKDFREISPSGNQLQCAFRRSKN